MCFLYLVSLQVTQSLRDRSLHLTALFLQFVVLLAEVLLLLQQRDVAPRQLLLIDPQHRQLAQSLAQSSSDFIGVLLEGVEQLLMGEMRKGSNENHHNKYNQTSP